MKVYPFYLLLLITGLASLSCCVSILQIESETLTLSSFCIRHALQKILHIQILESDHRMKCSLHYYIRVDVNIQMDVTVHRRVLVLVEYM